MSTKTKVDLVKLRELQKEGKTHKEIAEYFQVAVSTVANSKRRLKLGLAKTSLEEGHRVLDKGLNAIDQLQKINDSANLILDELTGEDKIIARIVKAVEVAITYEAEPDKKAKYIQSIVKQIQGDKYLALKAMAEIRGQLGLQLEIFKTFYDIEAVADFQKEVLEAIAEESVDVRNKIVQRLKKARTLRQSVRVSG